MSPVSPGRSRQPHSGTRRPLVVPVPTRPRPTKPAKGGWHPGMGWHPSMGPRPA